MNLAIIIGMAVGTVSSAVLEKVLFSLGKSDEAQYVNTGTKCLMGGTILTLFAGVITAVRKIA